MKDTEYQITYEDRRQIAQEIYLAHHGQLISFQQFFDEFEVKRMVIEISRIAFIFHDRFGLTMNCIFKCVREVVNSQKGNK